jgi:outer membrane protein assembly factor BamD
MFKRICTTRIAPTVALTGTVLVAGACGGASRHDGLEAPDMYRLAQQEVAEQDLGDAQETLDRLLIRFPEFDSAATASMLLGDLYFEDEKYITAAAQYASFISRYPNSPDVPRANFRVCESYGELSRVSQRDQAETRQALDVCRSVARSFFGTELADSAAVIAGRMIATLAKREFEIGRHYHQRNGFDAAIIYYERVVELYPETEWAPRSLIEIMDAYGEIAEDSPGLGYEQEVEIARERLLTQYPLSPEAERIRAQMAEQMRGEPGDTVAAAGVGNRGARTIPSG